MMRKPGMWFMTSLLLCLLYWPNGLTDYGGPLEKPDDSTAAGIHEFDVTEYGALPNDGRMDTEGIQAAIDICAESEDGGRVAFPAGKYISGTIKLRSNVTLYLSENAILSGSTKIEHYDPRYLIYAQGAHHLCIAGEGKIDGNGDSFWDFKLSRLASWVLEGCKTGDVEHPWKVLPRPGPLIELKRCQDVEIRDIHIENSPGWTIRPLACDDVVIHNVSIHNKLYGPNTDGIDIDSCHNVVVSGCRISAGDDAICLKNTDYRGMKRSLRDITVSDCVISSSTNAFKIGTDTRADMENITFRDSVIRPIFPGVRTIAGIALEMVDGGNLRNISVRNITMSGIRAPIFIRLGNRGRGQKGKPEPGTLSNVSICNVMATDSTLTSSITGLPDHFVENVTLRNIKIAVQGGEDKSARGIVVPERPSVYPEATMFGTLPAYGFYCRHVKGLYFEGLHIELQNPDERPMFIFDDVHDCEIDQ